MFEETNMKKQIKQFGIILIVVLAVMVLLSVFRFAGVESTLTRDIKDLWGVELPDGYAVAYRAATDVTMKDGGLRYHVLSYTDDAVLENWQNWGDGTQPARFAATQMEAAEDILSALNVPKGEWPEAEEVWYTSTENGSELVIVYDYVLTRLYLMESCK